MSLLTPYRALDLTDEKGFFCGKILADLGAEVIKIERPGGDPSRLIPPFYEDTPHPEKSLLWFAYNQGKKGITLNLEIPEGKDLFFELVKNAHWVIDSSLPGHLEKKGLNYEALARVNPAIILTRISGFGQTGPYASYKSPDIVAMAVGGLMYVYGDPDRPPVRISSPQAYLYAAADAAVGSLMALCHQQRTGEGQVVDVSAQQSVVLSSFNTNPWWDLCRTIIKRQGAKRGGLASGVVQRQTWPCRDGFVTFVVSGGRTSAKWNRALVKWMDEEGMADEFLRGIDWDNFDMGAATQEFHNQLEERIGRFFLSQTKKELYGGSLQRGAGLYPVADTSYHLHDPQLEARNFWAKVEYPELGTSLPHPGPFVKAAPNPLVVGQRAPRIGEHNQQVYRMLGLAEGELETLKQKGII